MSRNASPVWPGVLAVLTVVMVALIIVVPVLAVFAQALAEGFPTALQTLSDPDTRHAALLTALAVGLSVPLNIVFGIAAAWCIARFEFWGKSALLTLIDVPFTVSPVVAGMAIMTLFGSRGLFAPWLDAMDIAIVYAWPGIVLATIFVTLPFVARELIPLMQTRGPEQELAALTLGASPWFMFWRVTFPSILPALAYGTVLCTARAIGEFGAVSVVSGGIRGRTNTLPLAVEQLYNDYDLVAAFSVASMLALCGLLSLAVRGWLDRRYEARH
jgi:sulfate/thiosulfate transport system permease protein